MSGAFAEEQRGGDSQKAKGRSGFGDRYCEAGIIEVCTVKPAQPTVSLPASLNCR